MDTLEPWGEEPIRGGENYLAVLATEPYILILSFLTILGQMNGARPHGVSIPGPNSDWQADRKVHGGLEKYEMGKLVKEKYPQKSE